MAWVEAGHVPPPGAWYEVGPGGEMLPRIGLPGSCGGTAEYVVVDDRVVIDFVRWPITWATRVELDASGQRVAADVPGAREAAFDAAWAQAQAEFAASPYAGTTAQLCRMNVARAEERGFHIDDVVRFQLGLGRRPTRSSRLTR
jgi:hypothetical protein